MPTMDLSIRLDGRMRQGGAWHDLLYKRKWAGFVLDVHASTMYNLQWLVMAAPLRLLINTSRLIICAKCLLCLTEGLPCVIIFFCVQMITRRNDADD